MRILTFLFNLARNISFIIVVSVSCLMGYGLYTGKIKLIVKKVTSESGHIQQENDPEDVLIGMIEVTFETAEKIPVQSPTRTYFLRPEKILYFANEKGEVSVKVMDSNELKYLRGPISEIRSALENHPSNAYFFTRDLIINCNFVKGFYSRNESKYGSNYVYYVIMEDGVELNIPKGKYQDFLRKMESFTITVPAE